ncbi:DUF2141 domain-containing protein [Algoriphagus sp. H41]|uniref:DUF2141 domain-containing protein n=1 Tax=Algoriphagus oliviformis TaxID=2811231 RepID=A0ABS3CAT8_9BACT|nr:DUF2141 domain-containing protein [Algoriphagus oliviformis]MBN7812739.1 DUF2141 domain-containing protein [Algoriphagus oliviformis]
MTFLTLLFSLLLSGLHTSQNQASDLHVQIGETRSDRGKILVLVFDQEEGFPDQVDKAFRKFALSPQNGKAELTLSNLPPGKYAFTVLHDEDGDEKMATNFLGIPTEKYGFSNNPRIYFSPPSFESAAVALDGKPKTIQIKLR